MLRVFSDERCLRHEVPFGFPEVSERLRRVLDGCEGAGWEVEMGGKHPDVDAAIARIHDADYVRRFERAVARGDGLFCSSDNPVGKATWPAARAAVESALRAAGWMIDGADRTAFAAVRPPGHHAERDVAMGFCFFNNAAIAADYLRWRHGLDRVAVFDLDVHHGALQRTAWSATLCWAGLGPGEITLSGRKLVGISQRRARAAARLQCSWYRRDPTARSLALLTEEVRPPAAEVPTAATLPDLDAAAVLDALRARLNAEPHPR